MDNRFFGHRILNLSFTYPKRHWELDTSGQPPQRVIEKRYRKDIRGKKVCHGNHKIPGINQTEKAFDELLRQAIGTGC